MDNSQKTEPKKYSSNIRIRDKNSRLLSVNVFNQEKKPNLQHPKMSNFPFKKRSFKKKTLLSDNHSAGNILKAPRIEDILKLKKENSDTKFKKFEFNSFAI